MISSQFKEQCVCYQILPAIRRAWGKLTKKFDLMYAKKSFVQWYLNEGMQQSRFNETRNGLSALEEDYNEVSMDSTIDEFDLNNYTAEL